MFWCARYGHQRIGTETEELGKKMTSGDHPNYRIVKTGQNTKESPWDLRRIAVTQTLMRKNSQMSKIIITRNQDRINWNGIWHLKCAMLKIKKEKREAIEGIELLKQKNFRTQEKKNEITNIWEYCKWTPWNKQRWKKKKKVTQKKRKLLETKLCSRNLIKGINTCAVHLVRN